MIPTVVWGTGNVGRAAIRAVEAHPALTLTAVLVHDPAKVGRDAGELGGLGRPLGVAATDDIAAVLAGRPRAVVYAASGDIRPDDALTDIGRAIVIEHITRIHPSCAPDWPSPPDGVGAHRVVIEGRPRIEVTVEASDEGENRSAGGNATAVGRLVSAIDWLVDAKPGLYDALDVPLRPAVGRLGRRTA
ncbi:hypothetical protein AB0387_29670 [Streptomyces sp. NPDC089173]|uniref:hypothetical protein n=1 Tax=Streptomyces sp. NPDC089173 TaxID=3154965 RepID=UPI00344EDB4E